MKTEEIKAFLMDAKNSHNCTGCPYNDGFDSGANGNRLKCGQFHCWVDLHTKGGKK